MINRQLWQNKYSNNNVAGYRMSTGVYSSVKEPGLTDDNWLAFAIAVLGNYSVNKALLLAQKHS